MANYITRRTIKEYIQRVEKGGNCGDGSGSGDDKSIEMRNSIVSQTQSTPDAPQYFHSHKRSQRRRRAIPFQFENFQSS